MNFFGLQDTARRDSLILLGVFTTAMIVFGWIISKVTLMFSILYGYLFQEFNPVYIQVLFVGLLWSYVLYKCYIRHREINYGGNSLAMTFGAERLRRKGSTKNERELMNVVEEMSIASSEKLLPLYVFRNEPGINALVLGKQKQPALIVTQGLIDKLGREEISAVVAHEYAHISHRDLKLNMRMLVALAGLNAISELGSSLVDTKIQKKNDDVSVALNSPIPPHPILIFSVLVFWAIGCTLTFFGEILKSWFSRKRELLADAKAVQFTRSTWGLATVLDIASTNTTGPSLNSIYTRELDHLCFNGPSEHSFYTGWFPNHPAPESRIALIEPHYAVRKRSREYRKDAKENSQNSTVSMSVGAASNTQPIQEYEKELAIVLSIMIATSGYNDETSQSNFNNAMRCYTGKDVKLRSSNDPGFTEEFEQALRKLQTQSPAQKQAFLDHLKEIMEHDGINTPEEKAMLDSISIRLNPPSKAA